MLAIKSRRFNIDAVFKLIILLGFSLFFLITIYTGKVQLFVHPRIVPYLKFGITAMLAISMFIFEDIFKPQRKKVNVLSYAIFIIPLIMAFSLPAKEIGSNSMSFSTIKSTGQTDGTFQDDSSNNDSYDNSNASDNSSLDGYESDNSTNTNSEASDNSSANSNSNSGNSLVKGEESDSVLRMQDDTVVMDDNNFVKWLQEINDNPSKYTGKKIKVTGFVFKDKQFESNEFVPARLMMVCCAADMSPVGLLARYKNVPSLKQDSWFMFKGKIVMGEFKGRKVPVIDIESAEKTEKPKNEYVYPY